MDRGGTFPMRACGVRPITMHCVSWPIRADCACRKKGWPCPKWNTSCALAFLWTYNGHRMCLSVKATETVGCPIPHFSVQNSARERPLCGSYAPSIRTSAEPALGQAPQQTSTRHAFRHESADSEEDRKGLGCHLGQGLCSKRSVWERRGIIMNLNVFEK